VAPADPAAGPSPLPEGSTQAMLMLCLLDSFALAGCGGGAAAVADRNAFLDHGVITYRRCQGASVVNVVKRVVCATGMLPSSPRCALLCCTYIYVRAPLRRVYVCICRYGHVFSDLEYVLNSPGAPRRRVVTLWLELLARLQVSATSLRPRPPQHHSHAECMRVRRDPVCCADAYLLVTRFVWPLRQRGRVRGRVDNSPRRRPNGRST
jgi:hypothetical protein